MKAHLWDFLNLNLMELLSIFLIIDTNIVGLINS
jgi:hypothetical protein